MIIHTLLMLTALDLLKEELKNAHEVFESTALDIRDEHLHKSPGGVAFPLAATYAHLVFSEDSILHEMLKGEPTLFDTTWKDLTGASQLMPPMDANYTEANKIWANSLKLDFPKFRQYAQAVFKDTEEYLNTLKDEDLEKERDLGAWGKKTVAFLYYEYIIGHTYSLAGELSALKGVHGVKGYPF